MHAHRPHYEVAIIGGGSAGYATARTTAAAGKKTVVIEGAPKMGGLCILRGCMPTKALLWASEVLHVARKAQTWGVQAPKVDFDFGQVMARKDAMIKEFADYRCQQLSDGRFDLVRSQATFQDPHTVRLSDDSKLTADHFVIATGSHVSAPSIPGLAQTGYITSDEALQLTTLPRSLIVLGGGAVAVEFAQFFARFDVEVSLIQRSPHILRDFDTDAAEALETALRREGMTLVTNTRLLEVRREQGRKVVVFEHHGQRVERVADEILLALGRTPATASLGLQHASVETRENRILTNDRMQSTQPHIFAAGDCTGRHEIVHIAIQQGEIAAHNILHPDAPKEVDDRLLVSVVFTEPQVATVGLSEKSARNASIPFLSASYPFNDHGKSLIMEARDGFVKLLANPTTGEIIGGTCAGPVAGELIHEIVVAMHQRMTVKALASVPHYHPTLAEIWTYPAEELAEKIA